MIKNLNHIKAFIKIIDTGSISAASRQLRKSQTSVSNSVVNLELDLGVDLLLRDGHKATPTPEAIRLTPYFRNLLDYANIIEGVLNGMHQNRRKIAIYIDNAIPPSLCLAVEHLIQSSQFENVTIKRGSPADSMHQLKEGKIEIAITIHEEIKTKQFSQTVLGYCRGLAVCHKDFPLSNIPITSINDFVRFRQIALACSSQDVSPSFLPVSDQVCFVDSFDDMKSLIMQKIGWGIVPDHIILGDIQSKQCVDLSSNYERNGIVTKIYCYFSPELLKLECFNAFLNTARESISDIFALENSIESNHDSRASLKRSFSQIRSVSAKSYSDSIIS